VTEIPQIALQWVGRMEFGESVDNHLRQCPVGFLISASAKSGGYLVANHHTGQTLHQEERASDDGPIITKGHGSWCLVEHAPQPGKDAVLATHVMGLGRHWPQWWPSKYQFGSAELAHLRCSPWQLGGRLHPRDDRVDVELLVRPHGDEIGHMSEVIPTGQAADTYTLPRSCSRRI